jgi:hypothetical protein
MSHRFHLADCWKQAQRRISHTRLLRPERIAAIARAPRLCLGSTASAFFQIREREQGSFEMEPCSIPEAFPFASRGLNTRKEAS